MVDFTDNAEDFPHQHGCQPHGGFVQQHHFPTAHQGAGNCQHLLFTAGKRSTELVAAFLQAGEDAEHALKIPGDLRFVLALPGGKLEVFQHGQVAEDAAPLWHLGNPHANDFVG